MNVKLVIINGSKKNQVLHLRSEETIVGRQQGCDLRIPSPLVSRRHCRLSIRENCLVVEDLASANGSILNGAPVAGPTKIRPGDQLAIGPITFRVEYGLPVSPNANEAERIPKLPQRKLPCVPKTLTEEEGPIEMAELADDEVDVEEVEEAFRLADAGADGAKSSAEDGDERTLEFDDMQWKSPPAEDLHNLLSDMDED